MHGLSPPYMKEYFTPINDVHSYPTWFSAKAQCTDTGDLLSDSGRFAFPSVKSSCKKYVSSKGCFCGTVCQKNVKDAYSISSFTTKVKQHL